MNFRKGQNTEPPPHGTPEHAPRFWWLTLGSVGVVYGDIGTSPLYAFREAIHHVSEAGTSPAPEAVLGILSLILWSLIVVVTLKYVLLLLRADNKGEGGTLSLMALARKGVSGRASKLVFFLGLIGISLFYGDAAITPAISVMSAIEGLKLVTPAFDHLVLPIAVVILVGLFSMQKHGTEKVSTFFGPITALWFLLLGITGIVQIADNPSVLFAFNPWYAVDFLLVNSSMAMLVLGSVFLAITGAEALYADLGHFGRRPIQTAWLILVFPCLALNYMGQGALVLAHPEVLENPFFHMVPDWALLPLVLFATLATIIASQAVITAAYSVTRQAVQMGLFPRMEIRHTSHDQEGQIYMPKITRWLLWAVLLLCVIFGSSGALASAYGIAVTGEMVIAALLLFVVVWKVWNKKLWMAVLLIVPFLIIDGVFLSSNLLKIADGGYAPLFIAGLLGLLMTTWVDGTRFLQGWSKRHAVSMEALLKRIKSTPPIWVDGTAVFLTSDTENAPMALVQNLQHNKVMHKQCVILSVTIAPTPRVSVKESIAIEPCSPQILRVRLTFGYMQTPDVPGALAMVDWKGHEVDLAHASYFLNRRILVPDAKTGLPLWRDHIYCAMNSTAVMATDFFCIPIDQVVELGQKMEI